jgi:hypothetical protein
MYWKDDGTPPEKKLERVSEGVFFEMAYIIFRKGYIIF